MDSDASEDGLSEFKPKILGDLTANSLDSNVSETDLNRYTQEEVSTIEPVLENQSEPEDFPVKETANDDSTESCRSYVETQTIVLSHALEQLHAMAPEAYKPYIVKAQPFVATFTMVMLKLSLAIDYASPYVIQVHHFCEMLHEKLQPYRPDLMFPMFIGILMMLFGGYFMLVISCVEAIRICGWETLRDSFKTLYTGYCTVKAAFDADDHVDADGDGIADVLQIPKNELISRKIHVFLRAAHPTEAVRALSGIYSCLLATIATLQIGYARTIATGVGIGDVMFHSIHKRCIDLARCVVPEEYHKWIDFVLIYSCKSVGISIAWMLERVLSAFHSAVRGARLFTSAFADYTATMGYTKLSEGYWDECFAVACATIGISIQLSTLFQIPFLLNLFLWPVLLVEKFLEYAIAYEAF